MGHDPARPGAPDTIGAVSESGGRAVRVLRALVATLVVVGLGSSAHVTAGGAVQPVPLAMLLVLVGPLVWLLVRSRTSVSRMALAAGAGQVVTHLTLMAMAPATGSSTVGAHVHHAVAVPEGAPALQQALHLSVPMVLAHLLATVLAAVLLTRGEDAVRAVARWVVAVVRSAGVVPAGSLLLEPATTVRRLSGRTVRPVGGRAPPLHAC